MITRKKFIEDLQAIDPKKVLFPAWKRTSNHRGYAVEQALKNIVCVQFGQLNHTTRNGAMHSNPKWFTQLYTDIMWSSVDVTPRSILQMLSK